MTTTTTRPAFIHEDGCHRAPLRTFTGKYGGSRYGCPACKRSVPISDERADELNREAGAAGSNSRLEEEANPVPIDWPDLIAKAERRGVPVLRMDKHGDPHLIRTTAQLRAEWED